MVDQRKLMVDLELQLGSALAEVERRVLDGSFVGVEELRGDYPEIWQEPEAALELIYAEFVARSESGQAPSREDWCRRFPEYRDRLQRLFGMFELMAGDDTRLAPTSDTIHENGTAPSPARQQEHPTGYTLLDEIGRGGSAVVYRARQHSLNRVVAIKVLRGGPWSKEQDGEVLRREAELAARLTHPNIVQVFEVGEWNGMPFLSMELVQGSGLHVELTEHQRRGSWFSTDRAAELVETLARAMQFAHDHGVVHRDLKPANILVGSEQWAVGSKRVGSGQWAVGSKSGGSEKLAVGRSNENSSVLPTAHCPLPTIKIADFGLAVVVDATQSINQTTTVAGTPCYMAPEQAEGRKADIGPRSDVYSLGAILYELLTARPPFQGATIIETLDMVRVNEPVPPRTIRPQVPRDLETICLKCLNKLPGKRYTSALELGEDLRRFQDGKPIVARPVSALERGHKWVLRHPAIATLSCALLAAIGIGGVIQTNRIRESELARQHEKELNQELQANLAAKLVTSARSLWSGGQLDLAKQTLAECPEVFRTKEWAALHQLVHAEVASWPQPQQISSLLALSPDGTRLAFPRILGPLHGIGIIDATTGESIVNVPLGSKVSHLEFSADGRDLVAVRTVESISGKSNPEAKATEKTHEVIVWNLATKKTIRRWSIKDYPAIGLSGTGQRIAAADAEATRIWECRTGKLIAELPPFDDKFTKGWVSWDAYDKFLTVQSPRNTGPAIKVWDVDARRIVSESPNNTSMTGPLTMQPDGRAFAVPGYAQAAGVDNYRRVLVCDVATGAERYEIKSPGVVKRVTYSDDSKYFAFGVDRNIELHDARTGNHLASLRGHVQYPAFIRFAPDGRKLYSISGDRTIRTWDISPWAAEIP